MPSGKLPSRAERRTRERLGAMHAASVREVWRVSVLLWGALIAALLPMALRQVPGALPGFLEHLGRGKEKVRERKADAFVRHLADESG